MNTASAAELALQAEVQQLRERIAELESERQSAHDQAEEQHRKLLAGLQEEKDRLSAVIASISDEVWFADVNKQFTLANPSAFREFHLAGGDEIGVENLAASLEVYRPDGSPRPIEEAPPLRALNGETVIAEKEIVRTPGSGELRHRQVSAAPVKDASGNIVGSVSVVRDVTERSHAEEALRKQREWFRVTLSSIGDAVIATDETGGISFLNPVAAQLTGWTEEEALGRAAQDVFRIVNELTGKAAENTILRVLREQQPVALANHTALLTRDGREIPVEDSATPIRDAEGKTVGAVLVFRDVTERRRAQEQLQNVLNSITDGLLVLDKDWRYTYFSEHGARMLGMRREDLIGGCVWDLFPHARGTKFWEAYHRAVETGQPVDFEEFYPEPLNKWLECHCYPSPDGLSVYFHDITQRKRAEAALHESEAILRSFFDSPGVMRGMVELIDGRIVHVSCNSAAEELFGIGRQSISGKTAAEAGASQEVARAWVNLYEESRRTDQPVSMEYERTDAQGHKKWLLATASYLGIGHTENPRVAYTAIDLTARKQAEEQVRRAQNTFSELVERAPFGIYVIDSQFRIAHMNAASQEGSFRNVRPVIGRPFGEAMRTLWPEPVAAEIIGHFRHTLESGEPYYSPQFVNPRHDARIVESYEWELHRMTLPDGQYGVICYYFDSTKLREAEAALRASEERFRSVAENMSEGLLVFDGQGKVTYQNPASLRIHGFGSPKAGRVENENLPVTWHGWDVTGHPLPFEEWPLSRVLRGERFQDQVLRATRVETGQEFYASYNGCPIFDADGKMTFGFISIREITEQRKTEMALRQSEERLRLAQVCGTVGVWDWNGRTGSLYFTPELEQLYGLSPGAIVTYEDWRRLAHPADIAEVEAKRDAAIARHEPFDLDFRILHASGEVRWLATKGGALYDESGEAIRVLGVNVDITARKQAERLFDGVASTTLDFVYLFDRQGRFLYANRRLLEVWGMMLPDVIGKTCRELGYEQWHHDMHMREIAQVIETKSPIKGEVPFKAPLTGIFGVYEYIFTPVIGPDGEVQIVAGTTRDITERKRAEEALAQAMQRLSAHMDNSPLAIIEFDPQFRVTRWSKEAENLFGWTGQDILGQAIADLHWVHEDDADAVRQVSESMLTGKQPRNLSVNRNYRKDGTVVECEWYNSAIYDTGGRLSSVLSQILDITARKRAEAALRDKQKLESLGLLAGGVAHDFNNLLVGVIGNASLAQEMLPPDHPAAELMETVVKTGEQAAHLTRQMLAYSGKGKFLLEPLNISVLARDIIELARPSIPKKVALKLELDEDLPSVEADRGQVQQILMNFAINAAEAIGSHDGLITVRTGTQVVDNEYLQHHPEAADLQSGQYVVLEVRDTGCGMDAAVKAKIFDPFYSTKFTGRGLGLAAVAGIVRGHKGAIVVTSAPRKGSTFAVLFPPAAHPAKGRPDVAPSAVAQGSGVILVIDDEQVVRDMAKKALERNGYTVLVADGGLAAIDILKRHPGKIDLAVLDLSMPGMSGEETLPELRKIRPEVKIFVSSGYSESEAMTMFRGQRVSGFVQKPYTSAVLAEKVKGALG